MSEQEQEQPDEIRSRADTILRRVLDDEDLRDLITLNLKATKKAQVQFNCKKCGQLQVQWAEINDAKASLAALELLLNQTQGRPDVAKQEEKDRIVFVREVKGAA